MTARDERATAFEETVSAAGRVLEAELVAAGGDKAARRAAWARYGDAQDTAGDAFRAAQAAERAGALTGPAWCPCGEEPRHTTRVHPTATGGEPR